MSLLPTTKYKVRINCSTYNQANYIEDAMNGFCMQKTKFPFVAIIVDDASTDGEPEIIRKYLDNNFDMANARHDENDDAFFTTAIHKDNPNCHFLVVFLKYNFYSIKKPKGYLYKGWFEDVPYIALCEGDDYWTDSRKLQKQVDFLDKHEDYSCCCHRFKIYYENSDTWTDDFGGVAFAKHPNDEGIEVMNSNNFRTRFTWTLTLCFRKSTADQIVWPSYKFGFRDFNFHYHLLKLGKCWCFADYMGVYRKNNGGVWSRLSSIEGDKIRLECYEDLYKYNSTDNDILDNYSYWLDDFYAKFVRPPFFHQQLTKGDIKNLCFYWRHCWNAQKPFVALKKSIKCFAMLIGINKLWKK